MKHVPYCIVFTGMQVLWFFPLIKYDALDVRSSLICDWENGVLFNL